MKNIIKKYKYIILFVVLIIITSIFFTCNYKIIENYSKNENDYKNDKPSILDDPNRVLSQNTTLGNSETFYTCPDEKPINIYANKNDEVPIDIENKSIHENIYTISDSVDTAVYEGHDIVFMDERNNNQFSSTELISQALEENKFKYSCQDIKLDNTLYNPLKLIGRGALTVSGINKLNKNNAKYINPLSERLKKVLDSTSQANSCIQDESTEDCNKYRQTILNEARTVSLALDVQNSPFVNCDIDDISYCIATSFADRNYLASTRDRFTENLLNDASINELDMTLDEYKNTLAQNNESSLQTTSTYIIYLFFILVLIITAIMITLNIIKPDIITAETLIGYIIFLVLIIFVTSNYFNVDYGPLNKFLNVHLGNAGSRNIFQNIGYSA